MSWSSWWWPEGTSYPISHLMLLATFQRLFSFQGVTAFPHGSTICMLLESFLARNKYFSGVLGWRSSNALGKSCICFSEVAGGMKKNPSKFGEGLQQQRNLWKLRCISSQSLLLRLTYVCCDRWDIMQNEHIMINFVSATKSVYQIYSMSIYLTHEAIFSKRHFGTARSAGLYFLRN